MNTCKLDVVAVTVAIAVTWGAGVLFLGLAAWTINWGTAAVASLGSVYLGYAPTFWGSIIGMLWALVDGAIAGAIYAWIYNAIAVRRAGKA